MMQKTDRHFRYLVRLISPRMRLYTEMINTGAIIHGDHERFLSFAPRESPVALQLGGSEPGELARAALIASRWGYDEINLNCGCPSDRVQAGAFGAVLMREPSKVAACLTALRDSVPDDVVVSVKCRLGVDELYSYDYFANFIGVLVDAGCRVFHVHARKAWLKGLSPRENREVPPLEYAWVYRIKREFPHVEIVVNGGITSPAGARAHLDYVDGVMLGRQAYDDPYRLIEIEHALFDDSVKYNVPTRFDIIEQYLDYVADERQRGTYLKHMTRHLLSFFQGQPGARSWRRTLSTEATSVTAGVAVVKGAMAELRRAVAVGPH